MYDGKLITDKKNIPDAMNMHFCDVGRKLQSQLENCTLNIKDFMPTKNKSSFFLTPISKEDILLEIKNLELNKTHGHNMIRTKISNYALKYLQILWKKVTTEPLKWAYTLMI